MSRDLRLRFVLDALDRVTKPLQGIMEGSGKTAKALRETRDELRAMEQQQRKIAAYRQHQQGLSEYHSALDEARRKQRALRLEMEGTDKPTKKLAQEYARSTQQVERLEKRNAEQVRTLQRLQGELKEAGLDAAQLTRHEQALAGKITQTTARLNEQQAALSRAAEARRKYDQRAQTAQNLAVSGAATMGAGMSVAVPMMQSVGAAREYESVMTDIAQKSDMSREAARKLGGDLRKVARDTNQIPEAIQRGMDALTGKGLDATTSAKMMPSIGKAATAYKADMADLSNAAFAVHDNLKVPVEQTGQAQDIMAAGGKAGSFELGDMAQYFPELTAGYAALRQEGLGAVADLTAGLEVATKGAGSASEAANNVKNLINKINAKDTIGNFKKFGIDLPKALNKAYQEGKTPIEAIAELTDKVLGGNLERLSYLFGDQQAQAALRPLIQNMELYRQIRADALNAVGTVEHDFKERMEDSAEKHKAYQLAVEDLSLSLGGLLLPNVTLLIDKLTAAANRMSTWAEENPKLAQAMALTASGVGGLLVILGGLGIAAGFIMHGWAGMAFALTKLAPLFGPVFGGLRMIATGIRIVGLVVATNPILLAIMAIAGAVYLIYRNWDTIGPWVQGLWNRVTAFFQSGIGNILSTLADFSPIGILYQGFAKLMSWLGVDIPDKLSTVGKHLLVGLWKGLWSQRDWLVGKLKMLAELIPAPIRKVLGIKSPSRVFMGIGGDIMDGLDEGLEDGARNPLARVGTLSGQLTRALAVGATAPALLAAAPTAAGPATAPTAAAASASANTYNITIHATGSNPADIERAVRTAIDRIERERAGRTFGDR